MRIPQKVFDLIPNATIKNGQLFSRLKKMGDVLGRPMENRAIMGATAIITQPYIDSHNKRVDKETANRSKNRTIAKIIAGTTVGCIVRGVIYALVSNCTSSENLNKDTWKNLLTPRIIKYNNEFQKRNRMLNYKTVLSTILSLIVMLGVTNFLFDIPLTNYIANKLNKKDAEKATKNGGIK